LVRFTKTQISVFVTDVTTRRPSACNSSVIQQ
jgi:hypothetical protein